MSAVHTRRVKGLLIVKTLKTTPGIDSVVFRTKTLIPYIVLCSEIYHFFGFFVNFDPCKEGVAKTPSLHRVQNDMKAYYFQWHWVTLQNFKNGRNVAKNKIVSGVIKQNWRLDAFFTITAYCRKSGRIVTKIGQG